MEPIELEINKMPAANGRFGVMAAVTPRTILCGNERLYPAGNSVPSRWDGRNKPPLAPPKEGNVLCFTPKEGTLRHCEERSNPDK